MTTYRKNGKPIAPRFDDRQQEVVISMLANMILDERDLAAGVVSRIPEMGRYRLTPEMLSVKVMPFERALLRALYRLHDEQLPASREMVRARMAVEFEDADHQLQRVNNYRNEPPDVASLAFALGDWLEARRIQVAVEEMTERVARGDGDALMLYQELSAMLASVAPIRKNAMTNEGEALSDKWEREQQRRTELRKSGKSAGPRFPWNAMSRKIPALKKGEMSTWMARSKHGKSSLALIMADHMAYVQGYDVLMLHLETSAMSLADRIMARKLKVQPREFRTAANFDINSPKLRQCVDAVKKEIAEAEKHRGIIYYHHCPGATVQDIEAKIAEQQAIAEGHHRELVVILDYYQKIDWSTLAQREVDGFNKVAAELKNLAELYGIYLITFAQFNMDAQYGDKKTAWNGSGIVMYSQTVVRIEREEAQDDRPMLDKSGQPIQDLLGYPIYYHRRGQPSSHTILNVIMANDDEPGPVEVDFVNGYFMVEDTEANRIAGNREFMSQIPF